MIRSKKQHENGLQVKEFRNVNIKNVWIIVSMLQIKKKKHL